MIIKDFEQLSSRQRREFLINSCNYVMSVKISDDLIQDLFYHIQGGFYIEVLYSLLWEKFLEMTAFTESDQLVKYLREVDISDVYESLDTNR